MCLVLNSRNALFGNKEHYEKELYRYENNARKNKIEKTLKSFEISLSRFSYHIKEIMLELDELYDFAITYYAKYILSIVNKYQKDKNLLEETYQYLKDRCKNYPEICDELKIFFDNIKNPQNKTKNKVAIKDKLSQKFINIFNQVFDSNILLNDISTKNIQNEFLELLKNKNYKELFNFSFDNGLYELFIFLYIYCDLSFDYDKLIVNKNNSNNNISNNLNVSKAVESSSGGNSGFSANIFVSKEKMQIFKNMYYLKKYSHMNGPHDFVFNKKYITNIEHIFGRNIVHECVFNNIKNF